MKKNDNFIKQFCNKGTRTGFVWFQLWSIVKEVFLKQFCNKVFKLKYKKKKLVITIANIGKEHGQVLYDSAVIYCQGRLSSDCVYLH